MSTADKIQLVIGFGLLLLSGFLLILDWWTNRGRSVRSRLLRADRSLSGEFMDARRAMNDAAGQSWRNLTD